MAKHVLSFLIKIVLFAVIMITVAKTIHYDAQVNSFIANHFSYDDVNNIGIWVLGEPDSEPYDSVSFYIVFLTNLLISIVILSVATTAYTAFTGTASPLVVMKKFSTSTLRRIIKIFVFTFIFWALFRFLPYQSLFPDGETYSSFTFAVVIAFNLVMTIVCYSFIQKRSQLKGVCNMPIPAYMWLKDDSGAVIKGSADVKDREGSIEIIGFSHGLNIPVDSVNGKITGKRSHSPMMIEKEFDSSSPYLYKAVSTGQTLKSAEIRWYRINFSGYEECYFIMFIEGVEITGVNPSMPNVKMGSNSQINHMESVALMYDKITWHYVDGNVQYSDDWNVRA